MKVMDSFAVNSVNCLSEVSRVQSLVRLNFLCLRRITVMRSSRKKKKIIPVCTPRVVSE